MIPHIDMTLNLADLIAIGTLLLGTLRIYRRADRFLRAWYFQNKIMWADYAKYHRIRVEVISEKGTLGIIPLEREEDE